MSAELHVYRDAGREVRLAPAGTRVLDDEPDYQLPRVSRRVVRVRGGLVAAPAPGAAGDVSV